MTRSYRLVVLLLTLVAAPPLRAQLAPESQQRVKLELHDGRVLTGRVETLSVDSVRLLTSRPVELVGLRRDSLVAFRTSLGRSHSAGARRGAKIGALVGGGLGLLALGAGVAADVSGYCSESHVPTSVVTGILGSGLLVVGTVSGLAIGAVVGREQWGPRVSLVLVPLR